MNYLDKMIRRWTNGYEKFVLEAISPSETEEKCRSCGVPEVYINGLCKGCNKGEQESDQILEDKAEENK